MAYFDNDQRRKLEYEALYEQAVRMAMARKSQSQGGVGGGSIIHNSGNNEDFPEKISIVLTFEDDDKFYHFIQLVKYGYDSYGYPIYLFKERLEIEDVEFTNLRYTRIIILRNPNTSNWETIINQYSGGNIYEIFATSSDLLTNSWNRLIEFDESNTEFETKEFIENEYKTFACYILTKDVILSQSTTYYNTDTYGEYVEYYSPSVQISWDGDTNTWTVSLNNNHNPFKYSQIGTIDNPPIGIFTDPINAPEIEVRIEDITGTSIQNSFIPEYDILEQIY